MSFLTIIRAVCHTAISPNPADCRKAQSELGWNTEKTLQDACSDSWRWQRQNPDSYK
jgi:UDP-glucose 4-epimerase